MSPEEFHAVLGTATPDQLTALEQAHWRYITLIGDAHDVVDPAIAAGDREAFPHYASMPGAKRIFSEVDCNSFMISITGLSAEMCDAWADHEFYSHHGHTAYFPAAGLPC